MTFEYDKKGRKWIVLEGGSPGFTIEEQAQRIKDRQLESPLSCTNKECIHYQQGSLYCVNCRHVPEYAYEGRKDAQAINDNIYDRMMAAPPGSREEKRIAKHEFPLVMGHGDEQIYYESKTHKPRKREFKQWWEE